MTTTIEQSVAQIQSGMTIGIGEFSYQNPPMTVVLEIINQNKQDLTLVSGPTSGLATDILIGAGCVSKVVTAAVAFEGVVGIDNGLIVIPSLAYEDHVIGENIINALDKNVYIDPHVVKVFVKVESGKIVLSGNVPTWAAYDAILNIAQCTPGVVDVVDRLIVGAISGYNSQIPVQKV